MEIYHCLPCGGIWKNQKTSYEFHFPESRIELGLSVQQSDVLAFTLWLPSSDHTKDYFIFTCCLLKFFCSINCFLSFCSHNHLPSHGLHISILLIHLLCYASLLNVDTLYSVLLPILSTACWSCL